MKNRRFVARDLRRNPVSRAIACSASFIILLSLAGCEVWKLSNSLTAEPVRLSTSSPCPFEGTVLTLEIKAPQQDSSVTPEILEQVQRVFQKRLEGLGASGVVIQTTTQNQISIFLPGAIAPEQAERVLGSMAQLDFRKQKPRTEAQLAVELRLRQELLAKRDNVRQSGNTAAIEENRTALKNSNSAIAALFERTELTGKYLTDAFSTPGYASNIWNIGLRFDSRGAELFADITKSIAGTGRTIGIFLDEELLSAPIVDVNYASTGITGGHAEIIGLFRPQQAHDLAIQLRAGALPAPVEFIANRIVKNNICQTPTTPVQ